MSISQDPVSYVPYLVEIRIKADGAQAIPLGVGLSSSFGVNDGGTAADNAGRDTD